MTSHEITSVFDQVYSGSELFFGSQIRPEFAKWCDDNPVVSKRALDAGCGDGRYSLFLAEKGAVVTAVDFSEVGLSKLRRIATQRALSVTTVHEDLCECSFLRGYYDLITVDTVLGHLHEECRQRVSHELRSALRVGGVLYACVFTVEDPGCKQSTNLGDQLSSVSELASSNVHYFQSGELLALFPGMRQVLYQESLEISSSHGAPHQHGYATAILLKDEAY